MGKGGIGQQVNSYAGGQLHLSFAFVAWMTQHMSRLLRFLIHKRSQWKMMHLPQIHSSIFLTMGIA